LVNRLKNFPHYKEVLIGAGSGLIVLTLLLGGLAFAPGSAKPTASESASPTPSASRTPIRTCSVSEEAANPSLGTLQAVVLNSETGEVLFDRGAEVPAATASVMKSLTVAAALESVGPTHQVKTKVFVDPSNKAKLSLVGGGDITLSKTATGVESIYKGAPKLSSLVAQVKAWATSNGITQINEINLDSTLFPGSGWESSWQRQGQVNGWISEVTALQLDGDRVIPNEFNSPKTGRPVTTAGEQFKLGLGDLALNATFSQGSTPTTFVEIAMVQSQPMSQWISNVLLTSENLQTEAMGKIVAIEAGLTGTFESLDEAYKKILATTKLDFSGVSIRDASGLSDLNSVTPIFMAELMRKVDAEYGELGVLKTSLPVAGKTGSLSSRFKGEIADATGKIFAKSGFIEDVHTLNGIIKAKDGTSLTFTIYALKDVGSDVRVAIDTLATAFYRCGNTLSNK
jgi:D-alanyl-D-alanine carboxypeptidase/D-alanyl-D-alanine-endopeptidase (penicillin-binding protein 4)